MKSFFKLAKSLVLVTKAYKYLRKTLRGSLVTWKEKSKLMGIGI